MTSEERITIPSDIRESMNTYVSNLDRRLKERSDQLENVHLEAAIDAQLTNTNSSESSSNPVIQQREGHDEKETIIFEDYTNPNSVANCLSPYVPSSPERIAAFVAWVGLNENDTLLDIGCGDGRVCTAASKLSGLFQICEICPRKHETKLCLTLVETICVRL